MRQELSEKEERRRYDEERRQSLRREEEEKKRIRTARWADAIDSEKNLRNGFATILFNDRGFRYARCAFTNFETRTNEQREALECVIQYANNLMGHVESGTNLIIFGPRGTGKDHLLAALMINAIMDYGIMNHRIGITRYYGTDGRPDLNWTNGINFFSSLRDSFSRSSHETEKDWRSEYANPSILAISDPLPPVGPLTDFQKSALFSVLDSRYSHMRPTWITVNVADGAELDERMGPQNADRLRDGAIVVCCNWESFRKAQS